MIPKRLPALLLLTMLSGCATAVPQPVHMARKGIDAMVMLDDHRVTYFKEHGNIDRMCAEPDSDAALTEETGLTLGLSGLGKSERIGEQSGMGELALGGRSPAVLIAREFLYRACEMTNNLNSNEATTIAVYKMFLETLEKITAAGNLGTGTTSLAASPPAGEIGEDVEPTKEEDSEQTASDDSDDYDDEGEK